MSDLDRGEERFRLYRLKRGLKRAVCVATSPDAGGIGQALVTLAGEGEIAPEDSVGVLDTMPGGEPAPRGQWLVNPYPASSS